MPAVSQPACAAHASADGEATVEDLCLVRATAPVLTKHFGQVVSDWSGRLGPLVRRILTHRAASVRRADHASPRQLPWRLLFHIG